MSHLMDQLSRPIIFGHRGASAFAPENTLAAFKLALEHGADGVELDAKLTTDGRVVVIHDQTVDRTTGKSGVVREMSLAQLKAFDAGSFKGPEYAGEPIPTLDEVFEAVGSQTLINVEITNYTSVWDALPDRIADLVIKMGLQDHVMFSSFHPLNLYRIKRRLPGCPVGILTEEGKQGRLLRGGLGRLFAPNYIHPYYTDVDAAVLASEHQRGRQINVWTVDEEEDIRCLVKLGIDGIITDNPRLAKQIAAEK
jgi:glycerophosphoryl diester phosphodiesterase